MKRRVENFIKRDQQIVGLIEYTMGENVFYKDKLKSGCRFATTGFYFISFLLACPHELHSCEAFYQNL